MPGNKKQSPDPIDTMVGRRVKEGRQKRGLSQKEFAGRLGVTFQQLQKYEAATNRVSASRLKRVADALELPIEFFYRNEGVDVVCQHSGLDPYALAAAEAFASIPDVIMRRRMLAFAYGLKEDFMATEKRVRADTLEQLRRDGRIDEIGAARHPAAC
jgi:transcriptional regulator with XRE-family HTH domain